VVTRRGGPGARWAALADSAHKRVRGNRLGCGDSPNRRGRIFLHARYHPSAGGWSSSAAAAAPGVWAITNFVQDSDLFPLPALYDQPIETIHRLTDGKSGAMIRLEMEQKVRSRVLGRWLDNGFGNWFTTRSRWTAWAIWTG
jgi:hypothetical protein